MLPIAARADPAPSASKPSSPEAASDYEIGYRKPPRHTRFQPGRSGNPKGRPKGARSLKTMVREIMNQKLVVRTGGRPRKMKRIEAMLLRIVEDAFAGKARDRQFLLQYYGESVEELNVRQLQASAVQEQNAAAVSTDTHDAAILEALRDLLIEEVRNT